MANTYTQLYIQIVFAVKGRQNLIPKSRKEELHKYITGIVQKRKHKMLAINSMPDHIHIFVGLQPEQSISDLVRDIKTNSSSFITEHNFVSQKFNWQQGYGAFSYAQSQIDAVVKYILNQEVHHRKKSFKEEYLEFLQKFEVEYDERYLFDWIDGV
ncbi:MAG: IS200/IS605 family transposase [Chitinophagales bacterium]|nr:IS200/IS605 family transposase [Chitinophagales bacterium]